MIDSLTAPRSGPDTRATVVVGVTLVALLALVCAAAPAAMAVTVVVLGAGPHNWFEARYLLSRMPAKWGPLRGYFATGITGVVLLTASFIALVIWSGRAETGADAQVVALALWHTGLVVWIAVLAWLRGVQLPRRRWPWLVPAALVWLAGAWVRPDWASVALVYAHPVLALVFLERELAVRRQRWLPAYRTTLAALPLVIVLLWWAVPALEAAPAVVSAEAAQAGAFLLPDGVATIVLATHVFLESLHYLVWIVAIPLTTAAVPWTVRRVPLAARSMAWRRGVMLLLAAGLGAVALLWIAFAFDYDTTRQVYFTVAIAHVLAEVPFLLRLL